MSFQGNSPRSIRNRFSAQSTQPVNPQQGDFYYDDGTNRAEGLYVFRDSAWVSVPSGPSNLQTQYIANGGAETGVTTGWATYADAAGTAPVDGTGGTANVTITASATTPLRGAYSFLLAKDAANRQGQGWSYDFTIDRADQAKVLSISADYKVDSGTFVAGSTTTDSDVTVWIYDVTNAVIIQPSTIKLFSNSSTVPDEFRAEFQSASNSTSYRLIFHVGSTSASTYTLQVDNVQVRPSEYVFGTPITDWQSYTPTFTGLGTVASPSVRYRRVGSEIEIRGTLTTGTVTATPAIISLPSGLSINTNDIGNSTVVGWMQGNFATNETWILQPIYHTTTGSSGFTITRRYGPANTDPLSVINASSIIGNGAVLSFYASLPVSGWSFSVQTSDSTDTRVVAMNAAGDPPTGTLSNSFNTIVFGTTNADTHGAYNSTTGVYTVPVAGFYNIAASFSCTGTEALDFATTIQIYKNNTTVIAQNVTRAPANVSNQMSQASLNGVYLNAGDTIRIRSYTDASSPAYQNVAGQNYFTMTRVSGPSAIAATETIAARAHNSSTSISGTLATVVWTTEDYDTHGALSSGVFTCPAPGRYQVNTALAISGTFVLNTTSVLEIQKNGVAWANKTHFIAAAITNEHIQLSDIVQCNAGDTIRIQVSNSGTAPSIVNSDTRNFLSIQRLGL